MPATAERAKAFREERPGPFTPLGFLVMILAMGAEAVILYVLLKPSPIAVVRQAPTGEGAATRSEAELMAPTVVMPEAVIVSIPVLEGGTELRTAMLSVAIKIGKAEGLKEEELDLGYLQKVYVPKVHALMPRIRHLLISVASKKLVRELRDPGTQEKILKDLKDETNRMLHEHGVEKRVREVYWNEFHFD